MWPYPWTHVGTPSHLGHMDRVAATMPSQAHAGAAQEAPDIGQWEGQDVPLVRPSSCNVKGGIPSSRRYLPTYLPGLRRGPESLGGRSRGSGRSSNRSLTRSEINEVLRGATSKIVGDLTQEIREKLEPLMIPPQASPTTVGMSPHRVRPTTWRQG